jgi:hypothetical protein
MATFWPDGLWSAELHNATVSYPELLEEAVAQARTKQLHKRPLRPRPRLCTDRLR